jgi:D-alanine-D-alanine ligase
MKIGIAFDLKPKTAPAGAPDDWAEEFDSPTTIKAIAEVIRSMGHTPVELGDGAELLRKLLDAPPDLVFNLAEGTGVSRNREARVPAVCEMLSIPHTGSDVLTLALCLDKDMCRRVVQDAEVRIPDGLLITFEDAEYDGDYSEFPGMVTESGLKVPLIAKPVCEGSSKGIRSKCLIERLEDVGPTVLSLWKDYQQGVLLEEFIGGEEVTVGILGNDPPQVLGSRQVIPLRDAGRFVYSIDLKRDWENQITYATPPNLPPAQIRAVEEAALTAYEVLGIKDIARIDFRFKDGVPYFLEANPLPGLAPDWSDLVLLANDVGSSHAELVRAVITGAMKRYGMTG